VTTKDSAGAEHWQRIDELFYEALDLDPSARKTFLDQSCGADLELRNEVQSLLDASSKSLGFAQQAIVEVARQQEAGSELSGKRIGAYQLLRVVGAGGMGKVYLAERADQLYRQQVAIKVMLPGFGPAQGMLLRFSAERQILANLNHPNIARLLDAGMTKDGLPYLVMEYVNGISIDSYCRQNRLSTEDRLKLFRIVCEAVEYAHKNLVIHRDIKPGNILVTPEGVPKLLDFGIAKLLDPAQGDRAETRTTQRLMTPEYASPEQIRGDAVTTSTDVYALGVLLYELLADQRPFHLQDKSPMEAMLIVCDQEPESPSRVLDRAAAAGKVDGGQSNPELDNIVLMAMRKEPVRRYTSVAALASDIQAYLDGYPVQARTDAWSYRGQKFIHRHKLAVATASVAILTLIGFSIGMAWLAQKANRERIAAEQQRLTAQREAEFLASVFSAATPLEARGRPATARDLLDQGAKRIDTELASTPEVQATMLYHIGQAYQQLGAYPQAQALLERAHTLRRKTLGDNNLDVAETADGLARVYRLEGEYQKAEPLFREALAIRKKTQSPSDPQIAAILTSLGECVYLEGRNSDAESLLREALNINHQPTPDSAITRNYLGLLLSREARFTEAASLEKEAADIARTAEGADSPNLAVYLHNLAGTQMDMGNLAQGEASERQTLELWRKISGADHPDVAYSLNNLGWVLLAEGKWQDAEPLIAEAVAIRRKLLGEWHPLLAGSLNNWARVLQAKGDYLGAEKNFRQALEIMQMSSGSENRNVAKVWSNLGLLQLDRGDYKGAERYSRLALEMRRKLSGDDHPDVADSLIEVGLTREFQGDPAGAQPLLRQALDIRNKKFPAWHPDVIAAKVRLAEAIMDDGHPELAEPILRKAVNSTHDAPFPLLSWQIAEADVTLGACLAKLGRTSESQTLMHDGRSRIAQYPEAALLKKMERRLVSPGK
jgi:serine/threonine-protein kinase